MKTEERASEQEQGAQTWPGMSCCGTNTNSSPMHGCCGGVSETYDCSSMMRRCMAMCRWFPLVPVVLGIFLLLLGYYLDASITRMLWMSAAGFLILLGTFGFLMMSLGGRTSR